MADPETLAFAKDIRGTFASARLTPSQAKLYSQRIRRDMGRDGLPSFASDEVGTRLEEALLLIEAAWIEQEGGGELWRQSMKRAAEILEWLSQPSLRQSKYAQDAPIHLLSAAAYQLAGYPAMALGQLQRLPKNEDFSKLLISFIQADFPSTLAAVRDFWTEEDMLGPDLVLEDEIEPSDLPAHMQDEDEEDDFDEDGDAETEERPSEPLERLARQHVIMCIGSIAAYLRNGNDRLVERAVAKLDALAATYLHSRDPYSFVLARLTAATARAYVAKSLWPHVDKLAAGEGIAVRAALVQFVRAAYMNRRALVWPAQEKGIARLANRDSFVLCTPTGSGKTTIATLGAVQGLFASPTNPFLMSANIVLYLVPSRALAAEVETRLSEDLSGVAAEPVVVTGLYGGIDWGPTDAWIDIDRPAVVVCTFEKADALLRYLGMLFLDRVTAVIIDEAHMVDQDPARAGDLEEGNSRALRLEQLSTRLLRARDEKGFRLIALSAVAAKAAPALASWLGNDAEAEPILSSHRSTRQMLGRLEVAPSGRFDIRYDLMDGHSLEFVGDREDDLPYVPSPFPAVPGGIDSSLGPDKSLRAPTLWAALHLAAEREDGARPTVLISLMQHVITFAETAAELMDAWQDETLPNYWVGDESDPSWIRCLAAARDYFTEASFEYRLLKRGIAVHHGKMPALLARRLKIAIERGHVRVIIATSTLSEGVNLPVSTIILPSVHRSNEVMPLAEFNNLIGRAGRPGVATEGSALVIVPREADGTRAWSRNWNGYDQLVAKLKQATELVAQGSINPHERDATSGLAMLLGALRAAWQSVVPGGSDQQFLDWLGQTAIDEAEAESKAVANYLDSLDGMLLAFVQEVEALSAADIQPDAMETELLRIWRHTYAFAAAADEARLAEFWLARGLAIKSLYPDADRRRQLYRTGLNPRSGEAMLEHVDDLKEALISGSDYADRTAEGRFLFIADIIARLSEIPAFKIGEKLGRKTRFDWRNVLRWWLARETLQTQPTPKELSDWYSFVAANFIYRGSWGLGSVISVLLDRGAEGQVIEPLKIDDWPASGLPWIAFWLKELITWGTLDPVVAFLLARGDAVDRDSAAAQAQAYYTALADDADPNDILDPRKIGDWVEGLRPEVAKGDRPPAPQFGVELERPSVDYLVDRITVFPLQKEAGLTWIDPAGHVVARSAAPDAWNEHMSAQFQFDLLVTAATVEGERYLSHS